jgi:hypothetical protein
MAYILLLGVRMLLTPTTWNLISGSRPGVVDAAVGEGYRRRQGELADVPGLRRAGPG